MPEQQTLTTEQINKLLNCQDMLQASLRGLATATKKLNQATANIAKEATGGSISSRGSPYYKKIHNSQAAKDASKTIDDIVLRYEEDMNRILTNLKFLESQIIYQEKMQDLIAYYKGNISTDKSKIQDILSNEAIANRMSTYYQNKDDTAVWYRKYLEYAYWIVITILVILIIYGLYKEDYLHNAYHATVAAFQITKDKIQKKTSKIDKQANNLPAGGGNRKRIHRGGENAEADVGDLKDSKNPISRSAGLLTLLLIVPYIVKPLISLLKPILFPYA